MRTESYFKLIAGLSLLGLGVDATRPTKTINDADDGKNCDPSTEQYMHIEALDYHDHPKFTMRWRQTTGPCGKAMDESDLASWEVVYDGSTDDAPDHPPTAGTEGRIKFDLFVCSPYGEYELDLDVESFNDEGTSRWTRIAYEIENGSNQYHIWDSFFSYLKDDEDYAPTAPGEYTWPLEDATGYYKTFYAGPMPPLECENSMPAGTKLVGCFEDSSTDRLLSSDTYVLSVLGEDGMTAQICSDFCSGFDYFGLESGSECFCGTADEFEKAVESDQCGTAYSTLCTGDATTACGGFGAISVYQRTGNSPPAPAPTRIATPETAYSLVGCFADSKTDRIFDNKMVEDVMSAKICHELCDDGINTHFGTQYAEECWCAVDPDLTKNGEKLAPDACDMPCAGTTSGEFCGGNYKITAYKIEAVDS